MIWRLMPQTSETLILKRPHAKGCVLELDQNSEKKEGHLLIIYKALYGLLDPQEKNSGNYWPLASRNLDSYHQKRNPKSS